jgi:hypothetical protein
MKKVHGSTLFPSTKKLYADAGNLELAAVFFRIVNVNV